MNLSRTLLFFISLICFNQTIQAQPFYGIDLKSLDYAYPREYELGGISFEGTSALREEALIITSGLQRGSKIILPGDDISKAIRNLWDMDLFSGVEVFLEKKVGDVVFLKFVIKELPRLSKYTITGIPKSNTEDIRGMINLMRGDPVTDYKKTRIKNKITNYYVEKGYGRAKIDVYEKADTSNDNSVVLFVDIQKGEKVRIDHIHFSGNVHLDDAALRRVMKKTKEKPRLEMDRLVESPKDGSFQPFRVFSSLSIDDIRSYLGERMRLTVFAGSKLIEKEFENDKENILALYNSKGYRDAQITKDSVAQRADGNLDIYLSITEGNRYYFRKMEWDGNTKYPDVLLSKILDINAGDVYDQILLKSRLEFDMNGQDITSLYMDDGYLFFNVVPEETRVQNDSIDFRFKIYEGPQAIINDIYIKGNTKTNERVIRREIRTIPGNKFSRSDLIRSNRELAALNYFDPEQIGIVPIPHPEDGTVDIEYEVVEKPSDQIELSAGWGGGYIGGLYGSAGIVFNNFSLRNIAKPETWSPLPSGDGQQLAFRMQTNGQRYKSLSFSFAEPWLGGKKPNSLSLSFSYTLFNQDTFNISKPEASFIINKGVSLSFGKRLKFPDDFFRFSTALNYQAYELQNFNGFIFSTGDANNINLKNTFGRYSVQGNQAFPSGGANVALSVETSPPYSLFNPERVNLSEVEKAKWIEYHKWRFDAEWYTRLVGSMEQGKRKLMLKSQAKFGFLGSYNDDMGISTFERFRLGGDGISGFGGFRIYGYDIISLRGTDSEVLPVGSVANPSDVEQALNAPIFNKFTMELRYPVSLNPSSVIYGLAFLEGGNSYSSFGSYDPFNLRRSVGIGVRAILPMFGLLGFDYGIGFDEDNMQGTTFGEKLSNGAFHFKIGFEPE